MMNKVSEFYKNVYKIATKRLGGEPIDFEDLKTLLPRKEYESVRRIEIIISSLEALGGPNKVEDIDKLLNSAEQIARHIGYLKGRIGLWSVNAWSTYVFRKALEGVGYNIMREKVANDMEKLKKSTTGKPTEGMIDAEVKQLTYETNLKEARKAGMVNTLEQFCSGWEAWLFTLRDIISEKMYERKTSDIQQSIERKNAQENSNRTQPAKPNKYPGTLRP